MSMRSTNMLVANGQLDQTGLATRADGYYGFADGLQTVGFYLKNFIWTSGFNSSFNSRNH